MSSSTLPLTPKAHPRAGGENSSAWWTVPLGRGSSPRGRGKQRIGLQSEEKGGLIPARAGKTLWWTRASRPARAHPRAGGENSRSSQALSPSEGSSPRGRGKHGAGQLRLNKAGLIPARAGKTETRPRRPSAAWAHPRAGGENQLIDEIVRSDQGSSPRGRGKHFLTCAFIERIGQILETLELAVSSGSYSLCDVYATDAPRDPARSIGLVPLSNRDASSESVLRSRRASRDLPTSKRQDPARCAPDRPGPPALSSCSL